MYQQAKGYREAMKAKARRLAGEPESKVDSSTWTPSKPLNTSKKTGAEPITKPSAKGLGESYAARDTKSSIGSTTRGAFKKGGAVKRPGKDLGGVMSVLSPAYAVARAIGRGGKDEERDTAEQAKGAAMANAMRKHGGKAKRASGGSTGKGQSETTPESYPKWASGTMTPAMAAGDKTPKRSVRATGGRTKKADGGSKMTPADLKAAYAAGKKRAESMPEDKAREETQKAIDERGNFERLVEMGKKSGGRAGGKNWIKSAIKKPGSLRKSLGVKAGEKIPEKKLEAAEKKGGKLGKRAHLAETLKGMRDGRKRGGVTVINIGGKGEAPSPQQPVPMPAAPPPMQPPAMPPPPPAGMMPPPGGAPAGMMPPPGGAPLARKAGGRISKVAKSYKDMTAGSGSGEGRLQKTDIAKRRA